MTRWPRAEVQAFAGRSNALLGPRVLVLNRAVVIHPDYQVGIDQPRLIWHPENRPATLHRMRDIFMPRDTGEVSILIGDVVLCNVGFRQPNRLCQIRVWPRHSGNADLQKQDKYQCGLAHSGPNAPHERRGHSCLSWALYLPRERSMRLLEVASPYCAA